MLFQLHYRKLWQNWMFHMWIHIQFSFPVRKAIVKKITCSVYSLYTVQGCALEKIEGSLVL